MASLVTIATATVLLVFSSFPSSLAQATMEQSDDGNSGSIKFSTPDLSDEEAHSPFMPGQLKCDGCRVVAYQLYTNFHKATANKPKLNYALPESDVLDITEKVCTGGKAFENYGVKEIKKVKRLSGEGLETSDTPGIMQGGGKWPSRLMEMCSRYLEELDEMTIFQAFKQNPKSLKKFEKWLCHGEGIRGECSKLDKKSKKDEL